MSTKRVSISLLLAAALSLSGCGGGGTPKVEEQGNPVVADETAPQFTNSNGINLNPTIEEGSTSLTVATIEAEDPSGITFSLSGADAEYFELEETKVRAVYSTVLKFKATPDYEVLSTYIVIVNATDSEGNVATKEFKIDIEDKPFVFDVASNMGSILERHSGTLGLAVKEAKGDVTYEIVGSNLFTLVENNVTFNAPDFNITDGADNSYTSTITATDGTTNITLAVTASVMGGDTPVPVVKTYLLKSKREITDIASNSYVDYTYEYNVTTKTLIGVNKSGTNIPSIERIRYKYSDDNKIMRGYSRSGKLASIRVFEEKQTEKNKFAATILNSRLSVNEYVNYLREISDTVSFKNNTHLTKYIHGLDKYQTQAELYVYNSDDTLSRELTGNYTITSDELNASDLHALNAPTGGFPSASMRLNAAQLSSLNSGTMAFELTQETTYLYSGGSLTGRKYFGYSNVQEESLDVTVSYYTNDVIRKVDSAGISMEYDNDSLLKKVNNYNYVYTINGKKVTVTITNAGQTVATYNFEEE